MKLVEAFLILTSTAHGLTLRLPKIKSGVPTINTQNNLLSDCDHIAELREVPLLHAEEGQVDQSIGEDNLGYWGLGGYDARNSCSIFIKIAEPNFTLLTFLTTGSSILVTVSKISHNSGAVSNSTWIKKSGWTRTTMKDENSEGEGRPLGTIMMITIFNPDGNIALVKDNWSKVGIDKAVPTEESEADETEGDKTRQSIGQQMKEVNLYILNGVAGLILLLMVVVIFMTCVQRRCPPCTKGPSIDDVDEIVDTYDEDDLLDEILDTQLRLGLQIEQPQVSQVEFKEQMTPVFFSSNWASAFNVTDKKKGTDLINLPGASTISLNISPTERSNPETESGEIVRTSSTQALINTTTDSIP